MNPDFERLHRDAALYGKQRWARDFGDVGLSFNRDGRTTLHYNDVLIIEDTTDDDELVEFATNILKAVQWKKEEQRTI